MHGLSSFTPEPDPREESQEYEPEPTCEGCGEYLACIEGLASCTCCRGTVHQACRCDCYSDDGCACGTLFKREPGYAPRDPFAEETYPYTYLETK